MRDYEAKYKRYEKRLDKLHPKTKDVILGWIDSIKAENKEIKLSTLAGYIEKMCLNSENFKVCTGRHLHEIDRDSYKKFKLWLNEHYHEYTNSKRLNDWLEWFNDEMKLEEKGLEIKKIKNRGAKEASSKDDAEKVLYWDDILQIINRAPNTMTRALIAMQGECGMRPGELLGLKIGDVQMDDKGIKIRIYGLKDTGIRWNRLNKSLPFVIQWVENHPLKGDDEAPLWLSKGRQRGLNRYYKKTGWRFLSDGWVSNVFNDAGNTANLKNKRFYPNWYRHSSVCTKIWGTADSKAKPNPNRAWSPQESADWHGHSIETSQKIYQEKLKGISESRMLREMGEPSEEVTVEDKYTPKKCPFCGGLNHYNAAVCLKCTRPLSLEEAIKQDKELEVLKDNQHTLLEIFLANQKGDKQLAAKLAQRLMDEGKLIPKN